MLSTVTPDSEFHVVLDDDEGRAAFPVEGPQPFFRSASMVRLTPPAGSSSITSSAASADFVVATQAAGFRQRREGLSFRLTWPRLGVRPLKRVAPGSHRLTARRKAIYVMRYGISFWSHRIFWLARRIGQPWLYIGWARGARLLSGHRLFPRQDGSAFAMVRPSGCRKRELTAGRPAGQQAWRSRNRSRPPAAVRSAPPSPRRTARIPRAPGVHSCGGARCRDVPA